MAYSKSFPKTIEGSNYPRWEEVYLSDKEEELIDRKARNENIALMKECIDDAKKIIADKGLKDYQTDVIHLAIALFEKRASHSVYHKETFAKEKSDKDKK